MRGIRLGAWLGIGAQVVFTAFWLIAPLWQGKNYNPLSDSISDMYAVNAPGCRVMVVVLTICGAATILFTILGLYPALSAAKWRAWAASVLLGLSIFGVGDLLSTFEQEACRIADPGCTAARQLSNAGGVLDAVLSTAGIVLLTLGGLFAFLSIRRLGTSPRIANAVLVLAIVTALVLGVQGVGVAGLSGLLERVLALLGATTFVLLGVFALRSASTATPGDESEPEPAPKPASS